MHGKLGAIRIVGENVIVDNESQEAIKCFQIDPNHSMEAFQAINPPMLKKQELRNFGKRRGFKGDACNDEMMKKLVVVMPPIHVILNFEIANI